MEGWSQGGLGLLLTASALILAIALMVYVRYYMGIVFVLVGALAFYYGWPVLEDIFSFHPDCAVVNEQFALEEGYANNTMVCEHNLIATDNQTGEDCSCNGESATPQCVSYESACQNQYGTGFQGNAQGDLCSCSTANNTTQSAQMICSSVPQNQWVPVADERAGTSITQIFSGGKSCIFLSANGGTAEYCAGFAPSASCGGNACITESDYSDIPDVTGGSGQVNKTNGSYSGTLNIYYRGLNGGQETATIVGSGNCNILLVNGKAYSETCS